jgi:hypothetical protein
MADLTRRDLIAAAAIGASAMAVSALGQTSKPVRDRPEPADPKPAKYKLNAARLLVATYGKPFTADTSPPPQILAMNLDHSPEMQRTMDEMVASWTSQEQTDSGRAILEARRELGTKLSSVLGVPCAIHCSEVDYTPIYDKNGNLIGHDVVGWVFVNGNSMVKELPDDSGGTIGLVACVFLSVQPA